MKLVKKVVEVGNGAAVYIPKEYSGKEIVIILPEGIEEIRERVLTNLIKFMPNVLGVYIYGSYARNEQTKDSDIDLLIITREKDDRIKAVFDDMDIRVMTLESIKKSIKNMPAIIFPILREAVTFMNPLLIEELNKEKISWKKFSWNFQDILRIIKIIEGFIELDEKDISPSHIYSLIMRARVLGMIESLVKNESFSNESVKEKLVKYGLDKTAYEEYYRIYQDIRDGKKLKKKINKEEIFKLIRIIKEYLNEMKDETKSKK